MSLNTEINNSGLQTKKIVDYIDSFQYKNIPSNVVDFSKNLILDTLGVTWASSLKKTPISKLITKFVDSQGHDDEAIVFGADFKSTAINAALANGTMAHDIIELDEVHNLANTHSASVIVPAALAICEKEKRSGKDLIAAVVLAYDVECRLGIAMGDKAIYAHRFHPTSVCGAFGAATAAAYLLGLNKEEIESALGLAGCQASGLITWENEPLHMAKSFQCGIAARDGITAAALAKIGFAGAPAVFDGQYNVFEAFSGSKNYHLLTEGLGARFDIMGAGLKQYSSCRHTHSPLDAFMAIIKKHHIPAQEIKKITIKATEVAALMTDNNKLPTHNAQLVLAMAAFDGKLGVEQYIKRRFEDPEIKDLAHRTEYIVDPELTKYYPEKWGAIVDVETKDGRSFTEKVDYAKGDQNNPFTTDEIKEKFIELIEAAAGKDRTMQVIGMVEKLEEINNIRDLTLLLMSK